MGLKKLISVCALGFSLAGCASLSNQEAIAANDPLEPMNRFFFGINQKLDREAALPAATFYAANVPNRFRRTFRNFFGNLGVPVSIVNNVLQGQFKNADKASARFLINSSLGIGGLFDVATDWGYPERDRDFGETLGTYGVPQGPYLVLPFRGPTAVRDFGGNYIDGCFLAALLHEDPVQRKTVCRPGEIDHRVGGQPRQQHRHLSRHRAGLGRFLRHHAPLLPRTPPAAGGGQVLAPGRIARFLGPGTGFF